MRAAVNQANQAATTASDVGAQYGAEGAGISSTLTPFLTRELNNPGGYSQQDTTAMTSAALGGAGGEAGGMQTAANERAGATGNESGYSSSMDDIARQREKAAAGASEGIAGNNAELKQHEQQQAAQGLGSMYGTDTAAQLKAMSIQPEDINAESEAGKSGWFQNLNQFLNTGANVATAIAKFQSGGGGG